MTNAPANETAVTQQDGSRGHDASGSRKERQEPALMPAVDVLEDADAITLYADLPGVPKDKLDIRVDADTLVIEGELGLETPANMAASHAEVQVTRYRRTFTLSKELDASQVDAEFTQGVLRLRIPKAADAQPRRIAVQVH